MKNQRLPLCISILLGLSAILFFSSDSSAEKPKIYQKDARIKVEQSNKATITTKKDNKAPHIYETNNWLVREEVSEVEKVNDAIKVFQKRKIPVYNRRVWIYDKIIDKNDVFVDFITNDFNKDIVFSPDENFVYFLEYSTDDRSNLYGVNLATEKKFLINPADQFTVQNCKGKASYVVVSEKIGDHTYNSYHIFNLEGKKVNFIDQIDKIDDLENVVCY